MKQNIGAEDIIRTNKSQLNKNRGTPEHTATENNLILNQFQKIHPFLKNHFWMQLKENVILSCLKL